jgi:predicted ArsR family transcriptional regulator
MQAEVIRDVLSAHEQQLFLRSKAGKSPDGLAKIYRQYEGPNGVLEALNRIHEKIARGLAERAAEGTPAESIAKLAQLTEDDDDDGGIPVKRVPAATNGSGPRESVNGAGAAGKSLSTPPIRTAPATSSVPVPALPKLHAPAHSPAPPRKAESEAAERDERVEALLREEPRSAACIGEKLGVSRALIRKALERLHRKGIAESTGEASFDYTPSGPGGPPATVWRIVGDQRKAANPAERRHPTSSEARERAQARTEKVLAALRERAMSQRALCDLLGERSPNIRTSLAELLKEGKVRKTEHTAHDWASAVTGRGRPSMVWEASDGPAFVVPEPPVRARAAPLHIDPPVPVERCEHDLPPNVCFTCQRGKPQSVEELLDALSPATLLEMRSRALVDLAKAELAVEQLTMALRVKREVHDGPV